MDPSSTQSGGQPVTEKELIKITTTLRLAKIAASLTVVR